MYDDKNPAIVKDNVVGDDNYGQKAYHLCLSYLDKIKAAKKEGQEALIENTKANLLSFIDENIKNYKRFNREEKEYVEKMYLIKLKVLNDDLPEDESELKTSNSYKQAYLIMVSHNKKELEMLLDQLDFPLNDIYLHIDKKSKKLVFDDFNHLKYANLYKVNPINVNWGGYSQIRCEYVLMKAAKDNGPYFYYHFMQGESYPLKSQYYIHNFFQENKDKLFISIDNYQDVSQRVKTIFLFNEHFRKNNKIDRKLAKISFKFSDFQKKIGYDRFKKFNLEIRKGFCLWSIPDDFLKYLLEKEKLVHKIFKYSYCCDEIYIQTLAYNSKYRDRINFGKRGLYSSSKWFATWGLKERRPNYCFKFEDLPKLINSDRLFARKFIGKEGIAIMEALKKHIEMSNE